MHTALDPPIFYLNCLLAEKTDKDLDKWSWLSFLQPLTADPTSSRVKNRHWKELRTMSSVRGRWKNDCIREMLTVSRPKKKISAWTKVTGIKDGTNAANTQTKAVST